MMVGQVLMLTLAAASLDRSILMRGWVVRMQAALLTWESQRYVWLTSFRSSKLCHIEQEECCAGGNLTERKRKNNNLLPVCRCYSDKKINHNN